MKFDNELVASKTPFPAVILNEVKDLLQQNEEILRYAQNDIWELTHYEFNLFSQIPDSMTEEIFETLLKTDHFKLERIVSAGQATPPGEWYDQEANEWVILLKGRAGLLFEGEAEVCVMHPGDYVHIPAHLRHRVEWTDAEQKTVWLALHYR